MKASSKNKLITQWNFTHRHALSHRTTLPMTLELRPLVFASLMTATHSSQEEVGYWVGGASWLHNEKKGARKYVVIVVVVVVCVCVCVGVYMCVCVWMNYELLFVTPGDDTLKVWDLRAFKRPVNVATGLSTFFSGWVSPVSGWLFQ